jgi:polysaccharide deacetylase family protein (PEP-CTERM system associated)
MPLVHAFTVDVEDYFQVSAFEQHIDRSGWDHFPSRVVANTQHLLETLAKSHVQGTFFILGWVARKFPSLVRAIHSAGHEVGSHSYWHRLIYRQTPAEFRDDLRQSKAVLEDQIQTPVVAFRAPSFSITRRSLWALEVLIEEGFSVDSSVFPTRHDRYGIPGAQSQIHALETPSGRILEFPPTVASWGGFALPVGGGGYFRLYPYAVTRALLASIEHGDRRPFMFYVHPWEIDPRQPRLAVGSWISRFRHYVNLATTQVKLDRLLRDFSFGRLCDVLAANAPREDCAVAA